MYEKLIDIIKKEPRLYESTGLPFWDDEHISKYMLKAHTAEHIDSASRNLKNIKDSVNWIASLPFPMKKILDLGCGPGIYAELFDDLGIQVTAIDISKRSIVYAKESASKKRKHINYRYQDYLTINYQEEFDMVTLIYCDFGVLPAEDRNVLLRKVHQALKPGGVFIMDVFTANNYMGFKDSLNVKYEKSGFWLGSPHLCIQRNKRYEKDHFLEQYIIVTDNSLKSYNIWNHAFSRGELLSEFMAVGFEDIDFYGDVTGTPYNESGATICAVARKL